jgi:FMN phosphatase YigB (HAD superfamily)
MKKQAEYPLFNWLNVNNIESIFFDFDDTIIKTSEIFFAAVKSVLDLYAKVLPQLSNVEIAQIFQEIDSEVHARLAVNPLRWEPIVTEFERTTRVKQSRVKQALKIFANIYKQIPEFEQDAEIMIKVLKRWGIYLGLITHANVEWTIFKLESLGLDGVFETVKIADENKIHKDWTDWDGAAENANKPKSKILGVGDSIQGDVQAAVRAGFGKVAWVDKKNGWHMYRQGELPSGVLVVKKASKILQFDSNSFQSK